jgi:hypothetical protein
MSFVPCRLRLCPGAIAGYLGVFALPPRRDVGLHWRGSTPAPLGPRLPLILLKFSVWLSVTVCSAAAGAVWVCSRWAVNCTCVAWCGSRSDWFSLMVSLLSAHRERGWAGLGCKFAHKNAMGHGARSSALNPVKQRPLVGGLLLFLVVGFLRFLWRAVFLFHCVF